MYVQTSRCPLIKNTLLTGRFAQFDLSITARHGQITEAKGTGVETSALDSVYLHTVDDWRTLVGEAAGCWLNGMFGARPK